MAAEDTRLTFVQALAFFAALVLTVEAGAYAFMPSLDLTWSRSSGAGGSGGSCACAAPQDSEDDSRAGESAGREAEKSDSAGSEASPAN